MTNENALSALGLSAAEEAAYRSLLQLQDADADLLGRQLAISTQHADQILVLLTKRGLVTMVSDSRYVAAAPESSIVHLLGGRLDALRRGYDAVDELEQLYRDARARYGSVAGQQSIVGASAIRSRLLQLHAQAQSQVRMFVRPPLLSAVDQYDAYLDAMERGVEMRAIYDRTILEDNTTMDIVRRSVAGGVTVRFASSLWVKLVIIDSHMALIIEPGDCPAALVTEHPSLVAMASALFEQTWPAAVPVPGNGNLPDTNAPGPGPSDPDDRLLLSLLLAGLTDQAIAVRLGVGLRTVQRRVRELMDVAGVDTRIQLGWQANRKGWVV